MSRIPYWVQRANFSATDYDAIDVADGIRAFKTHDWRGELDLYSELERNGAEFCPPGIGFVSGNGTTLHICPNSDQVAMVHYHFTATRRLFGLIPISRLIVETRQNVTQAEVLELIGFFFEGQHDWILRKLGQP